MPLQDLTPQLRTRLRRVERAVGWFIMIAVFMMLVGFGFYVHHAAVRKGWFITKVPYSTSVNAATGMKVGDPVFLMGFIAGEITRIEANAPNDYYNVTVFFTVNTPHYGYLWSDSKVRITASDFLGSRRLELVKGRAGIQTVNEEVKVSKSLFSRTNILIKGILSNEALNKVKADKKSIFEEYKTNEAGLYLAPSPSTAFWLEPEESPALTEELGALVAEVKSSLPGLFALTNQLQSVLDNAKELTSNLNTAVEEAQPAVANLHLISAMLTNGPGALGEWLLPPEIRAGLEGTLTNATSALTNANLTLSAAQASLDKLVREALPSLENLANFTANLHRQVEANSNILSSISSIVIHSDELVQGLKRHWLLRSAFKTNAPARPKSATQGSPRSRQ